MARFTVCLLFVFGLCAVTSAQEQAPKAPVDGRVLQTLLDIDAKLERLSELSEEDRIDRQHEEAQLREECAALKERILQLEAAEEKRLEERLDDKLIQGMDLREKALADIDRRLAATRTVSAGRLGFLRKQVFVVSGVERTTLVARRKRLQNERTELMAQFMSRVLAKVRPITVSPMPSSILPPF